MKELTVRLDGPCQPLDSHLLFRLRSNIIQQLDFKRIDPFDWIKYRHEDVALNCDPQLPPEELQFMGLGYMFEMRWNVTLYSP